MRIPVNLSGAAANFDGRLSQQLQAIAAQIPKWIEGAIGGIFELFLIIVVIVYLLLRGKDLWNGMIDWLPVKLGGQFQTALPRSFRNYFIGQGTVALMLGIALAVTFILFRIPYGFLFGVLIETLALFPMAEPSVLSW